MVEYGKNELLGALKRNYNWNILSHKEGNWDFGDGKEEGKKYVQITAHSNYFSTNQLVALSKYLKNTPKDWLKEVNITPKSKELIEISIFCLIK